MNSEVPENVSSLKDFTVEFIVQAVAKGLAVINKDKQFDARLPAEMSARYKVCSALAKSCSVRFSLPPPPFLPFSSLIDLLHDPGTRISWGDWIPSIPLSK